MSRKFTESEIRAYSKNRYEQKLLRHRLNKLNVSAGIFHETSAKQRQRLVTECKSIRMTTGGSPVPVGFAIDADFDISKRVTRPWAYSVMDTTYNAVYRDAVIPLPKQNRRKCEVSRGLVSRSSFYSSRVMSSKSHASSMKSHRSDNIYQHVVPPKINRCASTPVISDFKKSNLDITTKIGQAHVNDSDEKAKLIEAEPKDAHSDTSPREHYKLSKGVVQEAGKENIGNELEIETEVDIYKTNDVVNDENVFKITSNEYVPNTRVIILPPMYTIDTKAYQDAERERTISRSRSRVSFSGFVGTNEQHSEQSKYVGHIKPLSPETNISDQENTTSYSAESGHENVADCDNENNGKQCNSIYTVDPETMHNKVRQINDVIYRGRRLKNYIKPEERYKLDPLIIKRRQNKMDKLTKESVSFLKRVNHENIRVEIAFPRSARKRILTKLVRENNDNSNKLIWNNNEPVMQKKIEYFMKSISDYISQQQIDMFTSNT